MDRTDRQIIELLRQNGRHSNVEIARQLGVSEGTIRKRVERLLADGSFRIVGLADPAASGHSTRIIFLLTVTLSQGQEVAQQLSALPEALSVYVLTGGYDILMAAVFQSDQHLLDFNAQLSAISGIVTSNICHVPQIIKDRTEWVMPEPPPPTILIVDDDPDFVETTRIVLDAEGFLTRSAASGQAALVDIRANPPDLVIMDVIMDNVVDGWNAMRDIRSDPVLSDLLVLVVSSITATDYLEMVPTDDTFRIDNFLSKPVTPSQLITEVRRLLKRR